jgi:hypothetical protein
MTRRELRGWVAGAMLLVALPAAGSAAVEAERHASFEKLLQRYVDERGRVAYRDLAAQDGTALDAYLRLLAETDPTTLDEPEQIAFWLNAYNAHAIKGVLQGYNGEGFFARKRFFALYSFPLAGATRTLDEIEHDILRARYREPRVHFALVCASSSCPRLRREAYRGDRLEAQLDEQTRSFLADPTRNQFGADGVAKLSMIFKWFEDDFVKAAGSVPAFLGRWVKGEYGEIEYLEYDWTLNAQPGQRPE